MADAWDPDIYRRFGDERALPFHELLSLARPAVIERAVDLGCGSGELTRVAAERLRVGQIVGIDSSPAMLAAAGQHAHPNVTFERGDLAAWTSAGDHDLVLANASLQWVGDHPAVLRRWTAALRPGGQLAVQMPANASHASHLVAQRVAAIEPFASAFPDGVPADPVAVNVGPPELYAELLYALGYGEQHVALRVYPHVLSSSAAVVDWVRGTTLTRFQRVLPADLFDEFVECYRVALLAEIGEHSPYFYTFRRILIWARLPS